MKVFYDSVDDGVPDTEITGIQDFPTITHILDKPSICIINVVDFEGDLYSTWEPLDFIKISVEDDSSNQLFIGYLTQKTYTEDALILTVAGFGIKLSWTPFNNNYTLEQGQLRTIVDGETITCYLDGKDGDEADRDYTSANEDYEWVVDQWVIDGQDKGIIIENPASLVRESWKVNGITPSAEIDATDGNAASTRVYLTDEDVYYATESNHADFHADVEFVLDSTWSGGEDVIPQAKYLQRLKINYRWQFVQNETLFEGARAWLQIYNYDTTEWENLDLISVNGVNSVIHDSVGGLDYISAPLNPYILEQSSSVTLSDYLDNDGGGNYDELTLRIYMDRNDIDAHMWINLDYLEVTIEYHADDVGAIMLPITSNAASTITATGADWDNLGVDEDDGFKIGENSRQILDDIITKAGLTLNLIQGTTAPTESTVNPNADSDDDNWEDTTGGDTEGDLYDEINDYSVAPDADYITITAANGTCKVECGLGGFNQTVIVTGIKVYARAKYVGAGSELLKIGYECTGGSNSTLIAFQPAGAWTEYTYEKTGLTYSYEDVVDMKITLQNFDITGGANNVSAAKIVYTYTISNFNKYDARDFKGSFCIGALKKINQLEGAHWAEDHELEIITIAKPDDFIDSTVDLTEADYDFDWEFEDKCNSINSVRVFGNAALRIDALSTAGDINSPIHQQIIDEGIAAYSNALKVAEAEVALLATKNPSIKLKLVGVQTDLKVGTEVHVTFERPTIAQALYPIRMIERIKFGGDIQTTIWCGLGQTSADEKIANAIIKASFMAHDAHQARIIGTPAGIGATITWGDIGGADAAVNALIAAANIGLEYDDDDPAARQILDADLTDDGAWHEFDLDGAVTVPSGAIGFFATIIIDDGARSYFRFRHTSQSNVNQVSQGYVFESTWTAMFVSIPLDINHKFDYFFSADFDYIGITVLWWVF